jgi:uncharacterized damage-inducible protein DinB
VVDRQFIAAATHFMKWNLERIERCVLLLTEEEFWRRPNENCISVGNQLLHLEGNIRQWIGSGLGNAADHRERSREFSATGGEKKEELLNRLRTTISQAIAITTRQSAASLIPERSVQAYVHDGTFIILHVVEHMSYHTGQIIYWTKQLRDLDLDMYAGDRLDRTV